MVTTYRLNANELSIEVLDAIRMVFKNKNIEISVSETVDETDYLLSSLANREQLLASIHELENGGGVEMTIEELKNKLGA